MTNSLSCLGYKEQHGAGEKEILCIPMCNKSLGMQLLQRIVMRNYGNLLRQKITTTTHFFYRHHPSLLP